MNTHKCPSFPNSFTNAFASERIQEKNNLHQIIWKHGQQEAAGAMDHLKLLEYQKLFMLDFEEQCTLLSTIDFLSWIHVSKIMLKRIFIP